MADISPEVESTSTSLPSIQSLRSRFETFALENAAGSSHTHAKPTCASPAPNSPRGQNVGIPETALTPRSRSRPSLTPDDAIHQSRLARVDSHVVRTKESASDLKAVALKRAPPPPPPSRIKRPPSSPVVQPFLRPVPVPPALQSPRASAECEPFTVSPVEHSRGADDGSENGLLGNVTALRNRFSSQTQVQTFKTSPPRPTTPRPPPRPPITTSNSDSVVEHAPPIVPPRPIKYGVSGLSRSPPTDVFSGVSAPGIVEKDVPPRVGKVIALLDCFAAKDIDIYKRPNHGDNSSSYNEPSILVTSPPALPVRRPPSRPLSSALFSREDSLDIPSSSNSSHYSPFSDDDSEVSEVSEVSLSLGAHTCLTNGSYESLATNGIHSPYHGRRLLGGSSESLPSLSPPSRPKPPPRPAPRVPPRRPNSLSTPSGPYEPALASTVTPKHSQPIAPPLPSRRITPEEGPLEILTSAPPLPARLPPPSDTATTTDTLHSPVGERKPLGNARLPPPPTRTIGLGDKLPPIRRAQSPSSDEESGSEEDPRLRSIESLPDSSRSSRRPPSMPSASFMEYKMHVAAHSGHVTVAGPNVVVASGPHIKYFDVSSNDGSSWVLDTRESMRGTLVSCLEFRSACKEADKRSYVWIGTKEGHLLEVDVRMGVFTSSKMGIHASQVTHIFRHGSTMITIDDTGKALIFDPKSNAGIGMGDAGDVSLFYTAPRVYRLGERADFVKLLGGLLWTAVRTDVNGVGTASVPVVRIYDIYAPGSIGRAVMPNQHAGAVTSGTILASHPDRIYLGHEGGYITMWNIATGDGVPTCGSVVKVSASDVLCLEGVNDRLWAGGRKGTITVYDVSTKPWVVTNCWDAHGGLPVTRVFVDPYSVMEMERLRVVSVGRDEQVRFWDGLLGADRIEQELLKREHVFSTFRALKVLIISWNVDAAKPESLIGEPDNARFLHEVLTSTDSPDIISFGFQEVIDLESRKMAAKTVLLGGKKKGDEGKINEKVTSSYKKWHDRLIQAVRLAMPPDAPYTVVHTESLVGLFMCMFVRNAEKASLKGAAIATIKRGMGGRYGNKGGIIARFVIDDSSLCFINCHLAAGQHHVRQRNADVAAFLEEPSVFPAESVESGFGYVGGGDGSMVLDHEIVFLNGDMNYRIDQRREAVIAAIQANDLEQLIAHDQLHKEMRHNRAFRLRTFQEGPLTFPPTYKYDRGTSEFDSSEKRRTPAWCDRVLWRTREPDRVELEEYRRWEVNVSDHRPVSAVLRVTVKRVVGEAREKERRVLEGWWRGVEVALVANAKAFYATQAVI